MMVLEHNTQSNISRYVSSEPIWAKQLEGEVELGKHEVTFTAVSPGGSEVRNLKIFYNNIVPLLIRRATAL